MSQPTVCLSFDWDGVSVWMAGGATDARSLSRGEFGPRVGVPRLLELCKRLGITATFFTPGPHGGDVPGDGGRDRGGRARARRARVRPRGLRAAVARRGSRRDPPFGRRDRAGRRRAAARDAVPALGGRGRALRDAARRGLHLLVVRDGRRAPALGARCGRRPVRRPERGGAGDRRSSRFRSRSSRATSRTSSSTATAGRRCRRGFGTRATSSRSGSTSSPTTPTATRRVHDADAPSGDDRLGRPDRDARARARRDAGAGREVRHCRAAGRRVPGREPGAGRLLQSRARA